MEILKFCIYERYIQFIPSNIDADFSSPDPNKIFFMYTLSYLNESTPTYG